MIYELLFLLLGVCVGFDLGYEYKKYETKKLMKHFRKVMSVGILKE